MYRQVDMIRASSTIIWLSQVWLWATSWQVWQLENPPSSWVEPPDPIERLSFKTIWADLQIQLFNAGRASRGGGE